MSTRVRAAAFCLLTLLIGACVPAQSRIDNGIGTDLPWNGLPEATRLQDEYVGLICHQVGAPGPGCEWSTFVQAGMNDIDERCDAYLAWLDERRRSTGPVLQQISDLRTATIAIMNASGSSVAPIAIAAAAFGLASSTFSNVNSRLLLELPHSTVQAVVLGKQRDFRLEMVRQRVDNRPAAIHALRSYLRICMPFTIEADITTTVTLYESGGPAALVKRAPMITADTIGRPQAPLWARTPLRPTAKAAARAEDAVTPPEKSLSRTDLNKLQDLICVPRSDGLDVRTRLGIKIYQQYMRRTNPTGEIDGNDMRTMLTRIGRLGPCDQNLYRNYFERIRYRTEENVKSLQVQLNAIPDGGRIEESGRLDRDTRRKVAAVRRVTPGLDEGPSLQEQITPTFSRVIDKSL